MYKVICDFADKLDKGFIYRCGDEFPRNGSEYPDEARIKELCGAGNALRRPLIAWVVSNSGEEEKPAERPQKGRKRASKKED